MIAPGRVPAPVARPSSRIWRAMRALGRAIAALARVVIAPLIPLPLRSRRPRPGTSAPPDAAAPPVVPPCGPAPVRTSSFLVSSHSPRSRSSRSSQTSASGSTPRCSSCSSSARDRSCLTSAPRAWSRWHCSSVWRPPGGSLRRHLHRLADDGLIRIDERSSTRFGGQPTRAYFVIERAEAAQPEPVPLRAEAA